MGIEDCGVVERGARHGDIFVHSIDGAGPGEVTDPGAAVAIFGVAGIEPEIEREGGVGGLVLEEFDSAVDDEFGLVA